jgi:hypothetical protein
VSQRPAPFRQADIKRALIAAQKTGGIWAIVVNYADSRLNVAVFLEPNRFVILDDDVLLPPISIR